MARKTRTTSHGRQADNSRKAKASSAKCEEPFSMGRAFLSPNPLSRDAEQDYYVEDDLQCIEGANIVSGPSAAMMAYAQTDARRDPVDVNAVPENAYVTNLADFLTEKGAIAPISGPAKRFADVLTAIVAEATALPSALSSNLKLDCFRRPGNRQCGGKIETAYDADGTILWGCPVCGSHGAIQGWKGTLWDCGADSTAH